MEKFNKTLHGYNPKEVNAFLDEVILQVDKMVAELKAKDVAVVNLQKEKGVLIEQINRYKSMETTMNKTIVAAQDSSEQIRRIAKQESDIIINEARGNANRIVSDALLRAEKTEYEAAQLRKNISVFKRKLRSVIESQLEVVDEIETLDL
ncbi:MAG: DivIVA domain-containing protein [Bacilli bacterium]|nr:DivIVA domain-containing protein [Bacilli bacterium]MDD3305266.1 DivIVA domain-containing protein [Bacilli bacterium]MDD4053938.1 DivIVA domain-containing protein [Bacilli bacterium]MDD4411198.1 DivIVA domain-containing protein [Bacilli bacterium]